MKPWFRVYNSILNDPKLLGLSLENQALFIKFLAVSNVVNAGGMLPKLEVISKMVGQRIDKVRSASRAMIDVGLLSEDASTKSLAIAGWKSKQFESDDATELSRRHREAKRNIAPPAGREYSKNGPRTCATDTETDTEKEREPPFFSPSGIGGGEEAERGDAEGGPTAVDQDGLPRVVEHSESTPEQIERVRVVAWKMLGEVRSGDVWIARCVRFARRWPAEWVELLIPKIASKLEEPDGQWLRESWAETTLQDWTRKKGPPPWAYPDGAGGAGGEGATWGHARPQRQPTERQRKLARHAEAAYAVDDDGEPGGEEVGEAAPVPAHREDEGGRRARA